MKKSFGWLVWMALYSCQPSGSQKEKSILFIPPRVKQPANDSLKFALDHYNAGSLTPVNPYAIGKFSFQEVITIPVDYNRSREYTLRHAKDYFFEMRASDIWKQDTIQYRYRYADSPLYLTLFADSMQSDGFEVIPNYNTDIGLVNFQSISDSISPGYYHYPVYIVNQTTKSKLFYGQDSRVYAIQEALDSVGRWRPIECPVLFNLDPHGRWAVRIHPQEFYTFLMLKYKGIFKTRIRIRIKIGDNLYVSRSFDGMVNPEQFYLPENKLGMEDSLFRESCVKKINEYYSEHFSVNDLTPRRPISQQNRP